MNLFFNYGYYKEKMSYWICKNFHDKIFFGGGDYYICATCHRKHPTPWGKLASKKLV